MKIGIFLPNWLGDLVMATPALRAIRRHFGPHTAVTGIMRPGLGELLAGTDWLDEQWTFHPHAPQSRWQRWALVRRMRRRRFDEVILMTNSLHTALLARLGGVRRRIGFVRNGRGCLLTGKLYPRRQRRRLVPTPMVDTYLALAAAAGCPPESPRLELATTQSERHATEEIWQRLGLRTDGRVVTLNSGGAYGAAKRWPVEHCGHLARRVAGELDHDVLVLCGPEERQSAAQIVRQADHPRVFSLADQPLGLGVTKACIQRSRLTVSTDSGPRHIAAALGKPVITLLGPTQRVWIDNPTVRGTFLQSDLDCIGCSKRVCPLGHHRCMRELSADRVYGEVARLSREESSLAA